MLPYLILCFVIATDAAPVSHKLWHFDGRIVGGIPTVIEEFPYQASLQYLGQHVCGGAIISSNFILTAAHCTFNTPSVFLTVRVGSSTKEKNGQNIKVAQIHQHPLFNKDTLDYDISVIRLAKNISFGVSANSIRLAPFNFKITSGTKLMVTGWGSLSENGVNPTQLQVVKVSYVDNEKCKKAYRDTTLSERMICAGDSRGGKDSCQGDSGGPLVANGVLVGIVSWGYGCARPEYPGVYSRVSQFSDYIREVTQNTVYA